MNPIGIAFGPGVADIRSRASQRIERGGEKGGESGIYFSRISINRGIFSLDSGIDPVKKKKKEEWRKCNYKLFHVEVLEIENIAKISSIDNIKIRRSIYINKLIKFLIILPRIKKMVNRRGEIAQNS